MDNIEFAPIQLLTNNKRHVFFTNQGKLYQLPGCVVLTWEGDDDWKLSDAWLNGISIGPVWFKADGETVTRLYTQFLELFACRHTNWESALERYTKNKRAA